MSRSTKASRVEARVPAELADAVADRAEQLGVSPSHIVREALAQAVSAPVDKRSRSYLALWLAGKTGGRG